MHYLIVQKKQMHQESFPAPSFSTHSQKLYTVLDRMYRQDRLMKLPAPPESIRIESAVVHWSLKIVYLIFGEDIF